MYGCPGATYKWNSAETSQVYRYSKDMRLTSTTDRQYVPLVDVVRHGGIWNSELIIRPINHVHQADNTDTYLNEATV